MATFEQRKGAELLHPRMKDPDAEIKIGKSNLPSRSELATHIENTRAELGAGISRKRSERDQSAVAIAPDQDIQNRAGKLIEAFRSGLLGLGTNEKQALEALRGLSKDQMAELGRVYEDRTRSFDAKHNSIIPGRNLITDIHKELSGVKKEAALALIDGNTARADAIELRTHLSKLTMGTKGAAEVLYRSCRTDDLENLKKEYASLFGRDLTKEIRQNIRGEGASILRALAEGKMEDAAREAHSLEKHNGRWSALFAAPQSPPLSPSPINSALDAVHDAVKTADREKHTGLAAYAIRLVHTPAARQLRNSEQVMQAEKARAIADGKIDPREETRLREDAASVAGDSKNFENEKLRQTARISTGVAVTMGTATGNPGTGALLGAVVKPLTSKLLAGEDYSLRDGPTVIVDAAKGAGAAAAGALLSTTSTGTLPKPQVPNMEALIGTLTGTKK